MNGKRAIKKSSANNPCKKSIRLQKEKVDTLNESEQIPEASRLLGDSIVRRNLLSVPGYEPYCGECNTMDRARWRTIGLVQRGS